MFSEIWKIDQNLIHCRFKYKARHLLHVRQVLRCDMFCLQCMLTITKYGTVICHDVIPFS